MDRSVLTGFLPWIAFAISSSFLGLKAGALIGLAMQLPIIYKMAAKHEFMSFDAFGIIFFIFFVIMSFTLSEADLERIGMWSAAVSYSGLALISWATIALKDPFTRQYARRTVPKELWNSELFLSSTLSIAIGWSVSFTGATIVSAAGALAGLRTIIIQGLALVCMLLAILWQKRIMEKTQARAEQLRKMRA
jgi:hypothetical protein